MIEYFSNNMWQVWAIVCILGLILELSSGDFFIMCFAIGALVTIVPTLAGVGVVGQVITFAVVSALSLLFVRPLALKYFHKSKDERLSNADALIGQQGRVSEQIKAGGFGRVAIDGDDWKARSADGSAIEKDATVEVVSRESIIITVQKV